MSDEPSVSGQLADVVQLPKPRRDSETSVESALQRRFIREFRKEGLTLAKVSQLLRAQGNTDPEGKRTAPSAGELYPLEVFLVTGKESGLPAGVHRHRPQGHALLCVAEGDRRAKLAWVASLLAAAGMEAGE